MTVAELYEWALNNNVVNGDIIIRDSNGDKTENVVPYIRKNDGFVDVELSNR
jgi:hypothetical protein